MKPQIDASNKRYANGCKAKRNQEATKPEAKSNQETTKHEPNDNVNENVKEKKKIYTCAFETLWAAYPRKSLCQCILGEYSRSYTINADT